MEKEKKVVDRNLYLIGDINGANLKDCIIAINKFNMDDKHHAKIYKNYKRKPIKLFIQSFGGSVYDGFALIDVMINSKTPVYTYAIGMAMSMGLTIFTAGHKRFVYKNTTLMYHELSSFNWDKLEGIKLDVLQMEVIQKKLDKLITTNTKAKQSVLDDYRNRKAEWYIESDEAVTLEFAHKIKK